MDDDLLIYVKPGQKQEIAKRHPAVDIESIFETEDAEDVVVCKSENGEAHCEQGEQWIDTFTLKKTSPQKEESE